MEEEAREGGARLGHAIVGFVQPHAGHERDFHHWYERDHLPTVGNAAPGTLATSLWLSPAPLRALRVPSGVNEISGDAARGTHLSTIWIEDGRLDAQQAWIDAEMERQRGLGRLFPHRDHLFTHRYRYVGGTRRDAGGVPPALALDRHYPGLVASWIEKPQSESLDDIARRLVESALPAWSAGSPVELALVFALIPRPASWPDEMPEPPGLDDRLLVLHFLDRPAAGAWAEHFADLGRRIDVEGLGRLLLAAPFLPSIAGTDQHLDARGTG